MSARGKEMCSRGGKARAAKMSAAEHSAWGKKMIAARHAKADRHEEWLKSFLEKEKKKEKDETRVISRKQFDAME